MSKEKDITQKSLFNCNEVFADIVNGFLCDGEQLILPEDLVDCTTTSQSRAEGEIHEQERDVAKFWSPAGARIAILGVENQTKADPDMPLRIIGYDGASYKEQSLQHDAAKRTPGMKAEPPFPAITIVLNLGAKRWTQPKSLLECIGEENIPKALMPFFNDYKIAVFDVRTMTEEDLDRFKSDFKVLAHTLMSLAKKEPYKPLDQTLVFADKTLKALSAITQESKFVEAYKSLAEKGEEGGISMCRIVEEFEQRGIAIGEQRGIAAGEQRVKNIIRSYTLSGSVAEAAKAGNTTEDEALAILKEVALIQ